jgi:hypothetical protein
MATVAAVFAMGLWLVSPRFDISAPSLIDDWSSIDNAPAALDSLLDLSYDPAAVHDPNRYRPGFTAAWNSLQWHTLGAPGSLTGPNAWNLLRLALFLGGLSLLTTFCLRVCLAHRPSPIQLGLWSAAPAVLILATPATGIDFARLGPVEPVLIGSMLCGGALLILAMRSLVARRHQSNKPTVPLGALLAGGVGYALWLLGVYQKEVSVCFLVFLPFLYVVLERRWQEEGVIDRRLYRYRGFQAIGALMVLPLLHMALEIKRLAGHGTTIYGASVPSGLGGWPTRLRESAEMQWDHMGLLGTPLWRVLIVAVPFLLLATALKRREVPWLVIGLVVLAAAV